MFLAEHIFFHKNMILSILVKNRHLKIIEYDMKFDCLFVTLHHHQTSYSDVRADILPNQSAHIQITYIYQLTTESVIHRGKHHTLLCQDKYCLECHYN